MNFPLYPYKETYNEYNVESRRNEGLQKGV
nr:MAG TPA: hypothetical protein [Caudoviricetes sp.]